ncbi:glycosyltransferase family 4 protein [Actinomadura fulvescens]|uniref:Glycosyltransferase n=1 Tax=Actinomadura fulvescens TaxID=46160 RepID=A0ABN3Q711_9ACTN
MRVLAMLHLYPPHHNAGAEWMVHPMLRALAQQGHAVDVLLSRPVDGVTAPYRLDEITVHPYRGKGDPVGWLLDDARRPDVLVTHLENVPRATILGRLYGVPVVHIVHNDHEVTRSWLVDDAALVVFNSAWIAEQTPHPRGIIVPPPVHAGDYATTPGDSVTLINLCEAKGAATFYALAERFPDVPFLGVVGAYFDQVRRDDLPNVQIVEHVSGDAMREQVYARTKVLLMPSEYESYGRVGVEAMHSGIPVIAHPTPGLRESLGAAGAFVDRHDVEAWAKTLRRLLTPRGWSAASKRARARVAELDPAADLARWVTAVEQLAGKSLSWSSARSESGQR